MSGIELSTVEGLASRVADGAVVAIPATNVPMALTRALVRAGVKDLHLVSVPTTGLQADLLIGAGAVKVIESAGVTFGEYGQMPRFRAAVGEGAVTLRDSTCPAIHAGLQAAEKGIPFIPLRGILGSDLLRWREDWQVIDNPFKEGAAEDPILLLPAIRPDIALFHAAKADAEGNVWIGRVRELMTMAHAARETLVTVEEIVEESLLTNEETAAGTLPALYVSAVAKADKGAWPLGLGGYYAEDAEHLAHYAESARTEEGFAAYLREHVTDGAARAAE